VGRASIGVVIFSSWVAGNLGTYLSFFSLTKDYRSSGTLTLYLSRDFWVGMKNTSSKKVGLDAGSLRIIVWRKLFAMKWLLE